MTPDEGRFVKYGDSLVQVQPAGGVEGILCRTDGGEYFFRVYKPDGSFRDYDLRHDDLRVTIAPDEMASFYEVGQEGVLDHSPEALGLVDRESTVTQGDLDRFQQVFVDLGDPEGMAEAWD